MFEKKQLVKKYKCLQIIKVKIDTQNVSIGSLERMNEIRIDSCLMEKRHLSVLFLANIRALDADGPTALIIKAFFGLFRLTS